MTNGEILRQAEAHIDAAWRKALVADEARLRADGCGEDSIAGVLDIRRREWSEQKTLQLAEVGEFLRSQLH